MMHLARADIFRSAAPSWGSRSDPIASGRGDVAIISHRANRLKDNGSAEEHERIAAWMRSRGSR